MIVLKLRQVSINKRNSKPIYRDTIFGIQ